MSFFASPSLPSSLSSSFSSLSSSSCSSPLHSTSFSSLPSSFPSSSPPSSLSSPVPSSSFSSLPSSASSPSLSSASFSSLPPSSSSPLSSSSFSSLPPSSSSFPSLSSASFSSLPASSPCPLPASSSSPLSSLASLSTSLSSSFSSSFSASGVEALGDAGDTAETAQEDHSEEREMRVAAEDRLAEKKETLLSSSCAHPASACTAARSADSSASSDSSEFSVSSRAQEELCSAGPGPLYAAFADSRLGKLFQRFGGSGEVSQKSLSSSLSCASSSSRSVASLPSAQSSLFHLPRSVDSETEREAHIHRERHPPMYRVVPHAQTPTQEASHSTGAEVPRPLVRFSRPLAQDLHLFPAPALHDDRGQLLILMELSRLRGEMMQLQLAAAKPANIIIQNKTEVAASSEATLHQSREEAPRNRFLEWLKRFFSSRVNQFLLLSGVGLGCYMLLEHWRYSWRMAQLRRRVDSNIVLRGVQMLEETIGVRRPSSIF
ncbi:hypothetical protein TGVAND_244600 [Toxoplasma gondii VAND]|uniref:Uncharacterized protein n=2 Tax=Toxoplasma gondii TaxID=5811 RepID=A0A086JQP4_TOXGO|nr:hypothetical protein TGP89_244600 [Toxoplasma gondii p89]KFH04641.1 hypothetical protein TGVAND_244600 [Toxoplasma gondii VAND]